MKHSASLAAISVVLVLGARALADQQVAKAPQSVVPFSSVMQVKSAHGSLIEIKHFARRADGATYTSETVGDPPKKVFQAVVDFPSGKQVVLFLLTKQKYELSRAGRDLDAWKARELPTANCALPHWTQIGTGYIQTEPVVISTSMVGKERKMTYWMAPRLGCEVLKYKVENTATGAPDAQGLVTQLDYGEPDPSLFEVSADYVETQPSVALSGLVRHQGLDPTAGDLAEWKRLDEEHRAQHPPKQ